jgi:hypothetical protein
LYRSTVVPVYALAILQQSFCRPPLVVHDWPAINNAIAERWSWHAVNWIKRQAWKLAEQIAREQQS